MQTPPAQATYPSPATATTIQSPVVGVGPADVYKAMREQRSEIRDQLGNLEEKRQELRQQLDQGGADESRAGIVSRIKDVDAQISQLDAQLASANAAVAKAASMPGAVVAPTRPVRTGPPPEVFVLSGMFMVICLLPLTIAYARRNWRRGATIIAPVPPDVRDRIHQLSEAVESIGLQVERIGEGQRFITKVFTEQGSRALAAGIAAPIPVPRRDVEP